MGENKKPFAGQYRPLTEATPFFAPNTNQTKQKTPGDSADKQAAQRQSFSECHQFDHEAPRAHSFVPKSILLGQPPSQEQAAGERVGAAEGRSREAAGDSSRRRARGGSRRRARGSRGRRQKERQKRRDGCLRISRQMAQVETLRHPDSYMTFVLSTFSTNLETILMNGLRSTKPRMTNGTVKSSKTPRCIQKSPL